MFITKAILGKTYFVKCGDDVGTCFTFSKNGIDYLVTARHIVASIESPDVLLIERNKDWIPVEVGLIGYGKNGIDLAVFSVKSPIDSESCFLEVGVNEVTLGEDVYFLGFPVDLKATWENNDGFPVPFVKKGVVSAIDKNRFYLDGHAGPGFSGGPVVRWEKPNQVIGVVTGHLSSEDTVVDIEERGTSYISRGNSGIATTCSSIAIAEVLSSRNI